MENSRAHHAIERIQRLSRRWNEPIVAISSIIIILIMLLVVADVSGRYLLNKPIIGATEISQMFLAFVAFLSLAWGLIIRAHLRVSLIHSRLPRQLQLGAEVFAGIVGIAFFCFLIWGGTIQFWESWKVKETMPAAITLPYWLPKLLLPFGAILMAVQFMIYISYYLSVMLYKTKEKG